MGITFWDNLNITSRTENTASYYRLLDDVVSPAELKNADGYGKTIIHCECVRITNESAVDYFKVFFSIAQRLGKKYETSVRTRLDQESKR